MRPPDLELAVGIECYGTEGAPCSARAKESAEDFVVEERVALEGFVEDPRPDYLPLYRVAKTGVDTMHMAAQLSEALRSKVSYAGLKDKRAVAVQYATPTSRRAERPQTVVRDSFRASLVGYLPRPLTRGSLRGNVFQIFLRDCCAEVEARVQEALSAGDRGRLPNFYGLQRFGSRAAGTHLIGKDLVRGDFEGAVHRMLVRANPEDKENQRAIQDAMSGGRYHEVVRLLPSGMDTERAVAEELSRHPADWVRALRSVPVALRRLYVQACQSWIFNRTISKAVERREDISSFQKGDNWASVTGDGLVTSAARGVRDAPTDRVVPMVQLVGYAYRDYGSRFDALANEVLDEEGIRPGQFFLREMQEVSAEGGFRRPHLALRDASWQMADRTAELKFALGKGQYATVLLREIIKPRDPAASGLA